MLAKEARPATPSACDQADLTCLTSRCAVRGSERTRTATPGTHHPRNGATETPAQPAGTPHTFATNLRGPAEPLTFAGAPVQAVIPIPNMTSNVTVTFGALSYAGTLQITVDARRSRADRRPAPGTGQRSPLTGVAETGAPEV